MEWLLYILLGVLVIAAVAMQIWVGRASELAGSRSGTVLFIRIFNAVLLVGLGILVVYALMGK